MKLSVGSFHLTIPNARPSLEMIRTVMDNSTTTVEVEEPMWPDNEDELARLFGLR